MFRFRFDAAPSQCAGVAATGKITLRNCSGGNDSNVNWAKYPLADGIVWYSTTITSKFLSSNNALGGQLFITEGYTGCYIKWSH